MNIAIVEDDQNTQDELKQHLLHFCKEHKLSFDIECFSDAQSFLNRPASLFSLVFLDIDLPGISGMKAAVKLREQKNDIMIIFVTSLAQYALKGYKVQAFDFIVKPFNYYSLEMSLNRALPTLKTKGKTVYDMVIKEELAMKMALGENPKRCYKDKGPSTRMANAAILRNALKEAKIYKETWDKYHQDIKEGKDVSKPNYNQKYDSLKRVFEGLKVKIHAHQADDIVTAIKISKEFNLDYTIEHATEGYLIPEFLKEHHVRCILGPTLGNKSKYELKAKSFKSAKVLFDNDIPFAFMTDHPVITLDTTLAQTGLFVKAGLDYLAALKANTINAAKIVGLDNIVGSIKEGKDADIVIYSKDPLSYDSHVLLVMLNGNIEVNKL